MTYAASPPRRTPSVARMGLAAGLLAAAATVIARGGVDTTRLADAVHHSAVPAPLLAIGGCAVLVCLLVPRSVLALAAGTIFGGYAGTVWAVLGVTAGALCAYAIGGFLGRDQVAARLRDRPVPLDRAVPLDHAVPLKRAAALDRAVALDRLVMSHGPWAVAAARMLPVVHFGASNYLFGTTSVTLPAYAAGTLIGVVPGTAAYAALGASMASGSAAGTSVASVAVMALSGIGIAGSAVLVRLTTKLPHG